MLNIPALFVLAALISLLALSACGGGDPPAPVDQASDADAAVEGGLEPTATDVEVICGGSNHTPMHGSLAEIWSSATNIVVAEVVEGPLPTDSDLERYGQLFTFEEATVSVEEYLKGSGKTSLTLRYTTEDKFPGPDGLPICDPIPLDHSLELQEGARYVLFLREGSEDQWVPLFEPGGFELDGQALMPPSAGPITPADWGVATLDDLVEQIAALQDESPE